LKTANDEALQMIASTLGKHTDVWLASFDRVLQKFDQRQTQEAQAWSEALATLNVRHEELEVSRTMTQRQATEDWKAALQALAARQEEFDTARQVRFTQLVEGLDTRQSQFLQQIDGTLEKALTLREGVSDLVEALHGISQGEGKLLEVQTVLAKNLRVIHETQKMDDALHGLTAAIHLLTARHRGDQSAAA
jgi:hypothetical protein